MKTRSVSQGNEKRRPGILGSMLLRLLIQRLFVPTLILLILSLALAGFFSHRSLEARQIELAQVLANTVETFLQNAENMLRSSAKVADLTDKAHLPFYLKSTREGFGYFDTIYRLDESGVIVQLEPYEPRYMGLDQSRQSFFRKAKAQRGLYISRPFNSMRTGKPTVNMTWPLANGGMMVAELNLGTFQDAVTAASHERGQSTIIIIDQAGTFLAHPRTEQIAQQARIGNMPPMQRPMDREAALIYRYDNLWMMGSYAQVSSTGWVVLVQVPLAVLYGALLKTAVPITFLCLVIWGIVVLTFRQRFWRYVVTPLTDLSKTAIAITSGDLECTAKVESEDEIGIVAKAFNSMTAQLREVISRLEERVDQLTRTREELKIHQERLESLVEERTEALTERTQQLEAQAVELSAAKLQAEAANAAKSDFLARMSHEIRTPLNAVIGLTNIVLKSELNAEQRDYLNKVQVASNNLLVVINDILDFSKVEAGRMDLEHHPFDLDQVMKQLADLFSDRIHQEHLELIFDLCPNLPRRLVGDDGRLLQVLTNLVANAVKFTDRGEIVVGAEPADRDDGQSGKTLIKFRVTDTGIGIEADVLPSLFEPFFQADTSLTREYEGTGLGLAICRRLVELMGGRLWAESTPGLGSAFYFTVLLETQKEEKLRLRLSTDLQGLKALVVDDSAVVRQALTDLLESFTFSVSAVDSGERAIEEMHRAADDKPYQLVLLDWNMPGMDGIKTARRIRELEFRVQSSESKVQGKSSVTSVMRHQPQTPIIILMTAYGHKLIQAHIDTETVDRLLLKPVKPSKLFNTIMELFGKTESITPEIEKERSPHGALTGRRVLVVEDSELNRDVAAALLNEAGLVVETAENGRVAVDKVTGASWKYFDAVLMDIQMPIMDGYEATRHIRVWEFKVQGSKFKVDETKLQQPETTNQKPQTRIPIIALTAHALTGERDKCLAAGMDDYLAKPIDEKQLDRVLHKWISPQKIQEKNAHRLQPHATLDAVAVLDTTGAIKRLGGRLELYGKVLRKFEPEYGKAHEAIVNHMIAGERETASRMAHSVKGAAAAIGADDLRQVAAELETVIKDPSADIDNLLSVFQSRLEQTMEAISRYLEAESRK